MEQKGSCLPEEAFSSREIKACPAGGSRVYIISGPKSGFMNEGDKISKIISELLWCSDLGH